MFCSLQKKNNNNNNAKNFKREGGGGGNHHLSYVRGLIISMALEKIVLISRFIKTRKLEREDKNAVVIVGNMIYNYCL